MPFEVGGVNEEGTPVVEQALSVTCDLFNINRALKWGQLIINVKENISAVLDKCHLLCVPQMKVP